MIIPRLRKSLANVPVYIMCILFVVIIASCATKENKYDAANYFSADELDTLMVNIVTYVGVKPRHANYITRHEAHYRNHYIQQANAYEMIRYFVDIQDYHYFYIIRPARHPLGNKRAVGGRFTIDTDLHLRDFEEIFVTHVMEVDVLLELADELFEEMLQDQSTAHWQQNAHAEWPDDRLLYDFEKKEWRYDVILLDGEL